MSNDIKNKIADTKNHLVALKDRIHRLKEEHAKQLVVLRELYVLWIKSLTVGSLRREMNDAYWAGRANVGTLEKAYREVTQRGFIPDKREQPLPCLNAPICDETVEHVCANWTGFDRKKTARERLKQRWENYLGSSAEKKDDEEESNSWNKSHLKASELFCCMRCRQILGLPKKEAVEALRHLTMLKVKNRLQTNLDAS